MFLALGYAPISSSAPRPLRAAYLPILLSEVKEEQRPSGNGDREAIVKGAFLCDGEGEPAYTVYDLILGGKGLFGDVSSGIINHFILEQTGIIRLRFEINSTIIRH